MRKVLVWVGMVMLGALCNNGTFLFAHDGLHAPPAGTTISAHDVSHYMSAAANRFLLSLNEEQKALAIYPFVSQERDNWNFLPTPNLKPDGKRQGLRLGDMNPAQQALAHALPAAALSQRGYLEVMSIMALEQVLFEIEKRDMRNPANYFLTIFGKPDDDATWGWRWEGHHLSVNVTIIEGHHFAVTPSFFGTNPAVIKDGPMAGTQVLVGEEQIALELITSLNDVQLTAAMIPASDPISAKGAAYDVLTSNDRSVERSAFEKSGIPYEALNSEQQKMLITLVNTYLGRFRNEVLAGSKYKGLLSNGAGLTFAWAGGKSASQQHYYRILAPEFLIEFANAQNNANHYHAVLRDYDGDFGRDFLAEHYAADDHADHTVGSTASVKGAIVLFADPDFKDWHATSKNKEVPPTDCWSFEGTMLVGENPKMNDNILWTNAEFKNYEINIDYMTPTPDPDYDTGVYVRGPSHQVQIGVSRSLKKDLTGCIYCPVDKAPLGAYPDQPDDLIKAAHKLNEWNHLRIIVQGDRIQTFLNEQPIVDYKAIKMPTQGPIGFQLHAGVHMKVSYKNAIVTPLD